MDLDDESNLGHRTTSFRGRIRQCSCNCTGLTTTTTTTTTKRRRFLLSYSYARGFFQPPETTSDQLSSRCEIQSNPTPHSKPPPRPYPYLHTSMFPAARAEITSSVMIIIGAAKLEPKLPVRLTTNHGPAPAMAILTDTRSNNWIMHSPLQ